MAKKLVWGKFSTDHLRVDEEDDIYESFPFLGLEGMSMVKLNQLCIGENSVRGIKVYESSKKVGLESSLFHGWDRTSWPIPFIDTENRKEVFDRRHTVTVLRELNTSVNIADDVPGAEYIRVFPTDGGVFNEFTDQSILTMAAMWGNVFGPTVDDSKDHQYETSVARIIKNELDDDYREYHGLDPIEEDLINKSFIREVLKYMGCFDRYNHNDTTINRIAGRILDALTSEDSVVGKLGQNNNEEDVLEFIKNSPDWKDHNTDDDKYIYVVQQIRDTDTFCFTYAERLLTRVCNNEKKSPQKITKVLIWNKSEANDPKKIVAARKRFKSRLNSSYQARRNNALEPVEKILNQKMIPYKQLSELKLEVWSMNQIEGEDEPFEMAFDTEE